MIGPVERGVDRLKLLIRRVRPTRLELGSPAEVRCIHSDGVDDPVYEHRLDANGKALPLGLDGWRGRCWCSTTRDYEEREPYLHGPCLIRRPRDPCTLQLIWRPRRGAFCGPRFFAGAPM